MGLRLTELGRKVAELDLVSGAENEGVLDHVFELANVSRKVVCHQHAQDGVRYTLNVLSLSAIEVVDEMFHQ